MEQLLLSCLPFNGHPLIMQLTILAFYGTEHSKVILTR